LRNVRLDVRGIHPATWVLFALVIAGVVLRVLAGIATWPVNDTYADSGAYAGYAATNPLADWGHPAGYSTLLAVIGFATREVAVVVILQHLAVIGAALLSYVTVRRVTGSPWPGLLPAGALLLNADMAFLEITVLSESFFVAMVSLTLYAAVRAIDAPVPWWRWPALTGLLLGLTTVLRSAALFLIPVVVIALFIARPRPRRRLAWRPSAATAGVALVLLLMYATANQISNGRFEVGPAQGWHMYARVSTFADCRVFTPPKGTQGLCDSTPAPQRSAVHSLFDQTAPLYRLWGARPWEQHDDDLRAFSLAVIMHQPRAYLRTVWRDLRAFFVPTIIADGALDTELDWKGRTVILQDPAARQTGALERFFNPYNVHRSTSVASFLHTYQRVFRFGATMLSIASLLTVIGLFIGSPRHRLGVLLFGGGGLAMLIAPVVSSFYFARYMAPLAAPMFSAAAITLLSLYRLQRGARQSGAFGLEDVRPQQAERRAGEHDTVPM
jgi:4-amino-4-deoxy-L-arabinose transferase-like glycosyltransferase